MVKAVLKQNLIWVEKSTGVNEWNCFRLLFLKKVCCIGCGDSKLETNAMKLVKSV